MFRRQDLDKMNQDELVNEISETRRIVAICLQRIKLIEEKFDKFTLDKEQRCKDEAARRRERAY
jgi:hypothetical protein